MDEDNDDSNYSSSELKWLLYRLKINCTDTELLLSSSSSFSYSSTSSSSSSSSESQFKNNLDLLLFITEENNTITTKSLAECIEYYTTQIHNWGDNNKKKLNTKKNRISGRFRRKTH